MSKKFKFLETKAIHSGEPEPRILGSVVTPIFQTAMFEYDGSPDYNNLKYGRLSNMPNHEALHKKLAALENGERAVVTASGMSAIALSLMTVMEGGGHFLAQRQAYGGTISLINNQLPSSGITCDWIDPQDPSGWAKLLKPETRAIYTEAMANPTMEVADHKAVVAFAKAHGLVSMIDSTFASPVNFRPLELGYDLSLHSATKYLNGHSDLIAGAAVGNGDLVERIHHKLNIFGACLDPHACFLLHRGLRTLPIRVHFQNESTLAIARFLASHPLIESVNYPGLESHSGYARAQELFDGCGGVLSFVVKGDGSTAESLIKGLQLPIHTFSLGGIETLIVQPSRTTHVTMDPQEREAIGITDNLIRLSVGLEATEDLISDFQQALSRLSAQ